MRGVHVSKPRAGGAAFKKCQCSARAFHQRGLLRKERKSMDVLHVDCETCVAREAACSYCVVMMLLGTSGGVVDLDPDEQAALQALAGSGLVPPLRLIPGARQVRDVQSPQDWRDYA